MPFGAQDSGPFYHGTKADPKSGELLDPGYSSNYGERRKATRTPRPEDYEDFRPKRYAATRTERVKSERGAPNTFLFMKAPDQDRLD
jgi:hypothetical protein